MIETKDFLNRNMLRLEPGDIIVCDGIISTIKEIAFQEWYEDTGFITEFTDTNGTYRSWKQYIDGGNVIQKEV